MPHPSSSAHFSPRGRRRHDAGAPAGVRRRPALAVSSAGVWADGGWGGAGVDRGALLAPPTPAPTSPGGRGGGRGRGGRASHYHQQHYQQPSRGSRPRTPGPPPPPPRGSRPHTPRYHQHLRHHPRQHSTPTSSGGAGPASSQRVRSSPCPSPSVGGGGSVTTYCLAAACTLHHESAATPPAAGGGGPSHQQATGEQHQAAQHQMGWCCPGRVSTVSPSDPLPGCLDADAAYVCTALAPSCFLIQKVREVGVCVSVSVCFFACAYVRVSLAVSECKSG